MSRITPFISSTIYGYSKYDFLLADNENIGKNGENLTITILSFNRSKATIKLLDSIQEQIKDYAGKVLIADNGSTEEDLDIIEKYIENSPLDIELYKMGKNYGVAGGRNRMVDHVKTEWFMSLDNDIYLIENPLRSIQETIATLGVKFLNLPLLSEDKKTIFSNGGALYTEFIENEPLLGGGSLFEQCKIDEVGEMKPSLSTFLLGGASVFNKEEFIRCGKFDENMFIGFEDLDFSITLFNMGMKIGNCPIFALVHDHTISTDEASLEYEKTRFSHGIIKDSALYFGNKRGFKVWNANVETWILRRQKELGIKEDVKVPKREKRKPRIALIVDVKGWCFWNIAHTVARDLKDYFDFEIISLDELDNNIIKLLFYTRDKFDLVHFFWRGQLSFFKSFEWYINECGLDLPNFLQMYVYEQNITTSVYDHMYLDDIPFTNDILDKCKNYTVSSNILKRLYDENESITKKPQVVVTDGVDLDLFKPKNLSRFKKHKELVVGWVGNSAWSAEIEDFKGFNTILKPALNELKEEGYPIKCVFADRQEGMIPHEKMPDYYSEIDVCLCASKIEGTPNPVLEGMACGVPIISTNVGIVDDALGKKQHHFIVERTKEAFKEKIIELVNNRELLEELSEENLKQIQKWTWANKTNDFKKFFEANLEEKNE